MRARVLPLVVSLFASVHAGIACSDDKHRAAYASGDCTIPPCGVSNTTGQGNGSGGARGRAEAGADASSSTGISCTIDPTSQLVLCAATTICDFRLDAAAFPGCGFIDSPLGIDLECICNGTQLCPIAVGKDCASTRSLANQRTVADICNQVVNGTCRDLGGVPATGQAGAASNCDRNCAATCPPNSPPCLMSCGC